MKTKSLFFTLIAFFLLTACSKSEETPPKEAAPQGPTFRLTYKAIVSTTGNTNFTSIRYRNAAGDIILIENRTTSWEESFNVNPPFNVFIEAFGTNDSQAGANSKVEYKVEEIKDGTAEVVGNCQFFRQTNFGVPGNWEFEGSLNFLFVGPSCGEL
jgi:hypothetical protein